MKMKNTMTEIIVGVVLRIMTYGGMLVGMLGMCCMDSTGVWFNVAALMVIFGMASCAIGTRMMLRFGYWKERR